MKFIVLASLILVSSLSFSQKAGSNTESLVKKAFAKVPASKYADLVPYFSNNKWGYIDRHTKKVFVQPIFYSPAFFNPGIRTYFNGEMVNISGKGLIVVEKQKETFGSIEVAPGNYDDKVRSSANGFKGFVVSSNGDVLSYSDLYQYNKQGIPGWNIQVIKFQGKYYGIVKDLKGNAGVINTEGEPMKGFEFNYNEILPNRNTSDTSNAWFFVKKTETENFSLINHKGEERYKNEIFFYPLLSSEVFGYTPYIKGDTSAIFDRIAMKWIIKPQTKLNIEEINFSSPNPVEWDDVRNRNKVLIYYRVREKDKQYYVDLKGNKYVPVK